MYLTQPPVTTVAMISNRGDSSGYYGYTAHIICNHDGVTFGGIASALGSHSLHHLAAILWEAFGIINSL